MAYAKALRHHFDATETGHDKHTHWVAIEGAAFLLEHLGILIPRKQLALTCGGLSWAHSNRRGKRKYHESKGGNLGRRVEFQTHARGKCRPCLFSLQCFATHRDRKASTMEHADSSTLVVVEAMEKTGVHSPAP